MLISIIILVLFIVILINTLRNKEKELQLKIKVNQILLDSIKKKDFFLDGLIEKLEKELKK